MEELKPYYYVVLIAREVVLINFYALIGQGVLYVLAGARREENIFYKIIKTIASPAVWVARRITPRFVVDRHVPWVALFILVVLGIGLTVGQQILLGMLIAE